MCRIFRINSPVKAEAQEHVLLRSWTVESGAGWGTRTPGGLQAAEPWCRAGIASTFSAGRKAWQNLISSPKPVEGSATGEEGVGVQAGAGSLPCPSRAPQSDISGLGSTEHSLNTTALGPKPEVWAAQTCLHLSFLLCNMCKMPRPASQVVRRI